MSKAPIGFALVLGLLASGCGEDTSGPFKYVFRTVPSPDKGVEAHLALKSEGGATVSRVHTVYLTIAGKEETAEKMFVASGDCDPSIAWASDALLLIKYRGGHCGINEFHSSWVDDVALRKGNVARMIEVALDRVPPNP